MQYRAPALKVEARFGVLNASQQRASPVGVPPAHSMPLCGGAAVLELKPQ
jgi:hypothetical protein